MWRETLHPLWTHTQYFFFIALFLHQYKFWFRNKSNWPLFDAMKLMLIPSSTDEPVGCIAIDVNRFRSLIPSIGSGGHEMRMCVFFSFLVQLCLYSTSVLYHGCSINRWSCWREYPAYLLMTSVIWLIASNQRFAALSHHYYTQIRSILFQDSNFLFFDVSLFVLSTFLFRYFRMRSFRFRG